MTERQRAKALLEVKLLDYIVNYKRTYNGNSPSYREMMDHMQMDHTGKLLTILQSLAKQQKIILSPGTARGISIPGTAWGYVTAEGSHHANA